MKVLVILGTRPEVIKLSPVIFELRKRVETKICTTGQHREMLSQALDVFSIRPDVSLDVMSPGKSLNILSSKLIERLDGVFSEERPDWVLIQGDTTSAFCAGFAAFHRNLRIGHVEAGLRTGDLANPFPEEANRSLLARITTRHFAPTQAARRNLLNEGIGDHAILVTGNTVVDAIQWAKKSWEIDPPSLPEEIRSLSDNRPTILFTCHRRENFGEILEGICRMLRRLCLRYDNYRWIFPLHFNPEVRNPVRRSLAGIPNLLLTDPLDYHANLWILERCALAVSDSGGIQEEAPSFGVPVVVMRAFTERMEGISEGFATLAGQSPDSIEKATTDWLDHPERRIPLKNRANPYGDGLASKRILSSLLGDPVEPFDG